MLYANPNLLLTESFHGNIEKVGRAQVGRTLPLRKKIVGAWFFSEKVIGPEVVSEKVVSARLDGTQVSYKKGLRAKVVSAQNVRTQVFRSQEQRGTEARGIFSLPQSVRRSARA